MSRRGTDTLYRIYSMTKPITSVALMMLYEEGHFLMENPVSRWLPELADVSVWVDGTADRPQTRPLETPLTVHHMLTHTSGLTYGFQYQHAVDELYRRSDLGTFDVPDYDLDECLRRLGRLPLLFEPGTRWNYSMSTDVCGAIVERMSGQPLDEFFRTRIFEPLGMHDTGFCAPESQTDRCSVLYAYAPGKGMRPTATAAAMNTTAGDAVGWRRPRQQHRRLPAVLPHAPQRRRTQRCTAAVAAHAAVHDNEPPARRPDPQRDGPKHVRRIGDEGTGFGLGFSVLLDPAANQSLGTPGQYAWGGAASTAFWVDPVEDLTVVFMTQLLPSNTYPLRRHLHAGVYQALLD